MILANDTETMDYVCFRTTTSASPATNGQVVTKPQQLDRMRTGKLLHPPCFEVSDVKIKLHQPARRHRHGVAR